MKEEKLFYDSTDQIRLCGLLSKINDRGDIVILCHGIRGDKDECGSFIRLTEALQENEINSFRFDFRAHKESSGRYEEVSIKKEIEDLECTMAMLKKRGFERFILLGASFGAGIISLLDHQRFDDIKGLICWYGALDYAEIKGDGFFSEENRRIAEAHGYYESVSISSNEVYRFGLPLFEEVSAYVPYEHLMKTSLPVLFVHGKADTLISYHLSEKVCELCKNGRLDLIEEGIHSFEQQDVPLEQAIDKTVDFVRELF